MKLFLDKEDIDSEIGEGLEIYINDVLANPTDKEGYPCPIYIEYHDAKVQIHIWDGKEDPKTTVLTNV
jgi:hypothetical protein